jgi:hypothetical protein
MPSTSRQRENLRHERLSGHIVFDRIWKKAHNPGFVRDIAYKWLAFQLGISRRQAHFSRLRGSRLRLAIRMARRANAGIVIHWWKFQGRFLPAPLPLCPPAPAPLNIKILKIPQ